MASPSRRPAGSPRSAGGQFAPNERAESDIDLSSGGTTTALLDHVDAEGIDPDHVAAVFASTDRVARSSDRRTGLSRQLADMDHEDVRQQALLQWWSDRQRGDKIIRNDGAYARTSAYFVAARYGDRMRAEDRRALRMLRAWESDTTQQLGRFPTRREIDAQAQAILDRRHLPTPGFHHRNLAGQETAWSAFTTADGDDLLSNLATAGESSSVHTTLGSAPFDVDESRPPMSVEPGSWSAAALSLAEGTNGAARHQVQARRISCAALAELRRAPMPQVGCLSHAAAASANTRLYRYPGGVDGAITTWRAGGSDAGTEALFAPFGSDLDDASRDQVCDLLELGEPKTLWNSAAWVADEHNVDTVARIVTRAG